MIVGLTDLFESIAKMKRFLFRLNEDKCVKLQKQQTKSPNEFTSTYVRKGRAKMNSKPNFSLSETKAELK